jgi:hypothetical protein
MKSLPPNESLEARRKLAALVGDRTVPLDSISHLLPTLPEWKQFEKKLRKRRNKR